MCRLMLSESTLRQLRRRSVTRTLSYGLDVCQPQSTTGPAAALAMCISACPWTSIEAVAASPLSRRWFRALQLGAHVWNGLECIHRGRTPSLDTWLGEMLHSTFKSAGFKIEA